jgi:poly(3-hydroxybutyrate) depolymerase
MRRRLMLWLAALFVLLPVAAFPHATLPEVKQLEATVPSYEPMQGIKMGISGLFERTIADTARTVKLYVPEGATLGAYMVVLNVPEGEATVKWLVDSGWVALADTEKFLLYVLEPGPSKKWGTADAERSYIETAYNNISVNGNAGRGTWYLPPESYYVVGYGIAGSTLHKVVMKDPTLVAAAAFVDASDIGPDVLAEMRTDYYPTPDWNGNRVAKSSIPLPVLIVADDTYGNTKAVIDYWKEANQTADKAIGFHGGRIYRQKKDSLNGYVAGSVSAVAVLDAKTGTKESTLSKVIYERFLSSYTRYGGNVGGNTVGTRADYKKLGVEHKTMVLDGRLREALVYVPPKAKAAARRGQNVPLVFSLHGAGMTMYSMFDFSRWWEIADEEGFILVFPTSQNTNNRTLWTPDDPASVDMTFIRLLLDSMKANYNVDTGRVYLGGQSHGAAMSQAIGRNLALSKNFAALGMTSFPSTSTNYSGEVLPFYMTFGEFDFWPYQLSTQAVGSTMTYWINRNHATGSAQTPASQETVGRHVIHKWNDAYGVNVVRYSVTKGRGHSIIPEEMRMLWDWYQLWRKDVNGTSVIR